MKILKMVWDVGKLSFLRVGLIIITILLLRTVSLFTIMLTVLVYNYSFDFYEHYKQGTKISPKAWSKNGLITLAFFLAIATIYYFAGFWGVVGTATASVAVILLLAGLIIKNNWQIFNQVTTWGADRITGKTKKEFKLKIPKKVIK